MMREDTRNWVAMAEYDLETARYMLDSGRYLYVIFLCHLALEKMLKAHVCEATQTLPPKTHDLIYLARLANLSLPPDSLEFIGKINAVSVLARYPVDLQQSLRDYPRPVAEAYYSQTVQVVQWLKQHPALNKS
ncbi:HEPN domain-containing protein [Thermanaerothrix sp.]|jgi:HEPN domain-containing protein|uniref:HEPN domain-containing protein n=1 Tax=Thermanaerothrix sp. TaxID=2972675 RepID=UPI002ADD5FD4|nr:HEPN domain-containing protein [Thermanaerothrix sp.]